MWNSGPVPAEPLTLRGSRPRGLEEGHVLADLHHRPRQERPEWVQLVQRRHAFAGLCVISLFYNVSQTLRDSFSAVLTAIWHRWLWVNTHFSAIFETDKMCILSHRSNFKMSTMSRQNVRPLRKRKFVIWCWFYSNVLSFITGLMICFLGLREIS